MDTRQLRAFLTVVDTGGISAAAEKLGYAQSSVSDQLRGLERDLGVSVLSRTSVGTVPTDAGVRLLPYARQLLDLDGEMRRTVAGARPLLRIGALESLAVEWLPDLLSAFGTGAAGPGTDAEVALSVGSRGRLAADLAAGQLDVIFTLDNAGPYHGPSVIVGSDRSVIVAAPEHPLARVHPVTMEDLRQHEFLVTEMGCTYRMLFDKLGEDAVPSLRIGMITGSLGALRRLTALGRGIAILPRFAAASDLDSGELVLLDLREGLADVEIEARWRPGLGAAERPMQALVRLAQRHSPSPRPAPTLVS